MTSQLLGIENFECEGDASSLGHRWENWKRALDVYLLATGIDKPLKKRAVLLHTGGFAFQEIYYNLPGANVEETESNDVFKIAIEKLDEYFSPKQSFLYERHIFRLLKQEPEEKFEKFLIRLRNQSSKCNFAKKEDDLIDQIVEKCSLSDLKKKILKLGDSATIEKIILEANSIETVERQLKGFQGKPSFEVNKIGTRPKNNNIQCTRCGSSYHDNDSEQCLAKDKICTKCGYRGHFRRQCRTRQTKRKPMTDANRSYNAKKPRYNDYLPKTSIDSTTPITKVEMKPTAQNINYVFHIDDDAEITCQVGGVKVNMLIDSGSKTNIIDDKTWEYLKSNEVIVAKQQKGSDQVFMSYGSKKQLEVLGSFETTIAVGPENHPAKFYVIKDGTRNLLGKETAMRLNVLKLGPCATYRH